MLRLIVLLWVCWVALPARAIVLNDAYFAASGGDVNNVAGTLDAGYADAREYSVRRQFQAAGTFNICTGTWIGNDVANNKTYFLTAAHCFEGSPATPTRSVNATFTDYAGRTLISGTATFHLPPERVSVPPGYGGASTDIGILEFNGQVNILGTNNQPIFPPTIYDGANELGTQVSLVGYGSWGIGSQGSNGGYFPSTGARRAGGTNVINNIFEQSHGMSPTMNAPGSGDFTTTEVAVASGDSGSAWWQLHDGRWTIIGTTNGGSGNTYGTASTAARVSQYVDWIQSIYPNVYLWSETGSPDINQDGQLIGNGTGSYFNDDVVAFIANWRGTSTPDNINPADLNIDGIVDLGDWWVLRQAFSGAGLSLPASPFGIAVPEPASGITAALSIVAAAFVCCHSRYLKFSNRS